MASRDLPLDVTHSRTDNCKISIMIKCSLTHQVVAIVILIVGGTMEEVRWEQRLSSKVVSAS